MLYNVQNRVINEDFNRVTCYVSNYLYNKCKIYLFANSLCSSV